jgi:predicted transcriptional regulator
MSPLVLSIRPVYVDMFRDGSKRFEYRRRRPAVESGDTVLIYETAPVSRIVATALIGAVYDGLPSAVWNATCHSGGVDRAAFDRYFDACSRAVAIEMEPTWLDEPVALPAGMVATETR